VKRKLNLFADPPFGLVLAQLLQPHFNSVREVSKPTYQFALEWLKIPEGVGHSLVAAEEITFVGVAHLHKVHHI